MDSYNKSEFLPPDKILPYVLLRLPLPLLLMTIKPPVAVFYPRVEDNNNDGLKLNRKRTVHRRRNKEANIQDD